MTISDQELVQYAERVGPVESAQVTEIGGITVGEVTLARTSAKTRTLQKWTKQIDVWDAVIGKFNRRDPQTRFTVRGALPTGTPVLLITIFDDRAEADLVAVLGDGIERVEPVALVNQLARATS